MTSGPDVERLFQQFNLTGFPYRELHAAENSADIENSSGNERWLKSLAILRREWERASATQAQAVLDQPDDTPLDAVTEQQTRPDMTSPPRQPPFVAGPIFPDASRPHLQRLFQRGRPAPVAGDSPLTDLFSRLS